MPELPDVVVYIEALERRLPGAALRAFRLGSPFVLRSVEPRPESLTGRRITGLRRLGKRIVLCLDGDLFVVIHLMIAGRLHWRPPGAALPRRRGLAALDFDGGTLMLTEAGSKRRASVHVESGEEALARHDRGGLEVLESSAASFRRALTRERHTLKRALTDPRILSGIGNAYSDEILHRARLSPFKTTDALTPDQMRRLHRACVAILREWIERLRAEVGDGFPARVTAFRPEMAVHGRYRRPCPACGDPVQRIVYAAREANYCATCQTGGRVLADRALSRLLGKDWPRSLEEMEERGLGMRAGDGGS